MSEAEEFLNKASATLETLFGAAKSRDEFAYVFALLGMNSGIEDAGWQPIGETYQLFQDFLSIANTPLRVHTQFRLSLVAYCQITESNYIYHILYNLLYCVEGESPPKVFNFLDKYKNGIPPSAKAKVELICAKADKLGFQEISALLKEYFSYKIRNAVSHADYILYKDELRLKHKGTEIEKLPLADIESLLQKAFGFFQLFFKVLDQHKRSYTDGHVISGRKNKAGGNLASVKLKVDPKMGLKGFSMSDPLPMW